MMDSYSSSLVSSTVAAVLLIAPFLIIGGLFSFLYRYFLFGILSSLFWVPFYSVFQTVILGGLGGVVHGVMAGGGPMIATTQNFQSSGKLVVGTATFLALAAVLATLISYGLFSSFQFFAVDPGWIDAGGFMLGAFGATIGMSIAAE